MSFKETKSDTNITKANKNVIPFGDGFVTGQYIPDGTGLLISVRDGSGVLTSALPVFIKGNYLRKADNQVIPFADTILPSPNTGTRGENFALIPLMEGILIDLSVSVSNTLTIHEGQLYAQAIIQFGTSRTASTPVVAVLCSGYVTTTKSLSYPIVRNLASVEYENYFVNLRHPADPALGAENIITVPNHTRWRIRALAFRFTTAGVATRTVNLVITDGAGHNAWVKVSPVTQLVATVNDYYFANAVTETSATVFSGRTQVIQTIPIMILTGGMTIQTTTTNIAAGDQYSDIVLSVDEWIDAGIIGGSSGGGGGGQQ